MNLHTPLFSRWPRRGVFLRLTCQPACLSVHRLPAVTITEAYFTAAEYVGTECKYAEPYGTDLAINIGGGKRDFSFVRSAKVQGKRPWEMEAEV